MGAESGKVRENQPAKREKRARARAIRASRAASPAQPGARGCARSQEVASAAASRAMTGSMPAIVPGSIRVRRTPVV